MSGGLKLLKLSSSLRPCFYDGISVHIKLKKFTKWIEHRGCVSRGDIREVLLMSIILDFIGGHCLVINKYTFLVCTTKVLQMSRIHEIVLLKSILPHTSVERDGPF